MDDAMRQTGTEIREARESADDDGVHLSLRLGNLGDAKAVDLLRLLKHDLIDITSIALPILRRSARASALLSQSTPRAGPTQHPRAEEQPP